MLNNSVLYVPVPAGFTVRAVCPVQQGQGNRLNNRVLYVPVPAGFTVRAVCPVQQGQGNRLNNRVLYVPVPAGFTVRAVCPVPQGTICRPRVTMMAVYCISNDEMMAGADADQSW